MNYSSMDLTPMVDTITNHILGVIQQETTPLLFMTGEVISVKPLQIRISNKQTLSQDELLLSATVKETWIDIPTTPTVDGSLKPEEGEADGSDGIFMHRHHIIGETEETNDGGQGAQNHKHSIDIYTQFSLPKIRLWRGLIVGDIVRLLKIQGGQFYYVLEREESITNETSEVEDGGN